MKGENRSALDPENIGMASLFVFGLGVLFLWLFIVEQPSLTSIKLAVGTLLIVAVVSWIDTIRHERHHEKESIKKDKTLNEI